MLACALATLIGTSLPDVDDRDREILALRRERPDGRWFLAAGALMTGGGALAVPGVVTMIEGFWVPGFCWTACGVNPKPGLFEAGLGLVLGAVVVHVAAAAWMIALAVMRGGERGRRLERLEQERVRSLQRAGSF